MRRCRLSQDSDVLRLWRATINSRNGLAFAVRSEQAVREEIGALIALGVWILMVAVFRISSLAALVTAVFTPIIFVLLHQPLYAIFSVALALLVFIAHRANIGRLLAGTEPRIGEKK